MAKGNLAGVDGGGVMELGKQSGGGLGKRRGELQKQLEGIALLGGEARVARRGKRSPLSGRKVPPKYRGSKGETWAGRGAKPRWLVAAIKEGKKLENFLIDKSARKGRKKRRLTR